MKISSFLLLFFLEEISCCFAVVINRSTRSLIGIPFRQVRSSALYAYSSPEFTINDNNDDDNNNHSTGSSDTTPRHVTDEPYTEDDRSIGMTRRPRKVLPRAKKMVGTSWMEKNAKFSPDEEKSFPNFSSDSKRRRDGMRETTTRSSMDTKTFRQDFRGTRVFVQGIPPGTSWQDLKDHFKTAGSVVFASVSVDPNTGETKGHGIVQFETTGMAQNAIQIMRDYPLNGAELFVRQDVQESPNPDAKLSNVPRGPTPPTMWKCANEENAGYMSSEDLAGIQSLIKARDDARRRKKYEVSDRLRDELKHTHGVFIDDRLKMWWTAIDGNKVPQTIQDINGDGRWKLPTWRMIPTTPENDACVNPDLVEGLLKQRDIARREKDFSTADALLEQARTAPDGDLTLRIHDESRTWRVWTDAPPPLPRRPGDDERAAAGLDLGGSHQERVIRECLQIVEEYAPEKVQEIKMVLQKFEGREFQILKRLKNQYL